MTTEVISMVQNRDEFAIEFAKRLENEINKFEQEDHLVETHITASSTGRMTAILICRKSIKPLPAMRKI